MAPPDNDDEDDFIDEDSPEYKAWVAEGQAAVEADEENDAYWRQHYGVGPDEPFMLVDNGHPERGWFNPNRPNAGVNEAPRPDRPSNGNDTVPDQSPPNAAQETGLEQEAAPSQQANLSRTTDYTVLAQSHADVIIEHDVVGDQQAEFAQPDPPSLEAEQEPALQEPALQEVDQPADSSNGNVPEPLPSHAQQLTESDITDYLTAQGGNPATAAQFAAFITGASNDAPTLDGQQQGGQSEAGEAPTANDNEAQPGNAADGNEANQETPASGFSTPLGKAVLTQMEHDQHPNTAGETHPLSAAPRSAEEAQTAFEASQTTAQHLDELRATQRANDPAATFGQSLDDWEQEQDPLAPVERVDAPDAYAGFANADRETTAPQEFDADGSYEEHALGANINAAVREILGETIEPAIAGAVAQQEAQSAEAAQAEQSTGGATETEASEPAVEVKDEALGRKSRLSENIAAAENEIAGTSDTQENNASRAGISSEQGRGA